MGDNGLPGDAAANDIAALESLIYENPDLERLEAALDDFNSFEAMRWTRQETRHSAFLRWILDPTETHGLGPYFLRAFAKRIAHRAAGTAAGVPSVFDVDTYALTGAEVLQEWNNIDILVRDDAAKLILVVENKIDSSEHSNQLQRYREVVEKHYPDHRPLYAFLTIGGNQASDENYVSLDYSEIAQLVSEAVDRRQDQLGREVRSFLLQYVEMVRRNILEESEIQKLCHSIYRNHKRALDVLFEYRPDKALDVTTLLIEKLKQRPDLVMDHSTKAYVRFIPREADLVEHAGDGWTQSRRLVLFEIANYDSKLTVKIVLGPGPQELREEIHDTIAREPGFNRAHIKLYPQYWTFHMSQLISKSQYENLETEDVVGVALGKLDTILHEQVPRLKSVLDRFRSTA